MNTNPCLVNYTGSSGFLHGFVEAGVEMPPDGLNGDCIIHYGGSYSNCKMKVRLLNGLKEGVGTIVKDGTPFIQIEHSHGVSNGPVCRMDEHGVIELKGRLRNGIECGLFEEYDGTKVAWRGYYRNGERYSEVVESGELDGYFDERSIVSGFLLSTSQYDDSLHDKNGRCFEYENGSLKSECVYENGVKKYTVREFVDGKMIVYYSVGMKVYEGVYYGNMKSGFLCHEPMEGMAGFFKEVDSNGQLIAVSEYDELNVYRNGKCIEMEDGKVKRVCLYEYDHLVRVIIEFDGSTMIQYNRFRNPIYEGEFKTYTKGGIVREGRGSELDDNGRLKRVCLFENDEIKQVLQEFNGDTMTEHNDCGKRMYIGEFTGDWKSGFKRNGRGYCLDEKETVKQYCEFENGVVTRVLQSFDGPTMTEYDNNGIVCYIGEWKGDIKNGFVREGRGKEYDEDGKTLMYSGEWKNGDMDGKGMRYHHGHVLYIGEWKCGMRNGKGEELNESGEVVFKGKWTDGRGEGREMDESGNVVYEGGWSHGRRNGKGEEKTENGMSAIGEWKDGRMENGIVYEKDGNRVRVYENGEMIRVEERELYGMILSRRIDSKIVHILAGSFFSVSHITSGDTVGVFRLNRKLYSVEWSKGTYQGIMVDMDSKEMTVYVNGELTATQCTRGLIDLDTSGRRWEGSVKDGKSYGYGVMYDEEGRKEYEGWMMDGVRICCGIEYYSDIGSVKYEGYYSNNKRFGKGIFYDRHGSVEYDSLWENDKPYSSSFNGRTIDSVTRLIRIPSGSFNKSKSFILHSFIHSLKRIVIGDNCFESACFFELDGLRELESVLIGQRSFYNDSDYFSDYSDYDSDVDNSGDDGMVSGDDGMVNGNDGMVNGDDGMVNGDDGMVNGDDSNSKYDDSSSRYDDSNSRYDDSNSRYDTDSSTRNNTDPCEHNNLCFQAISCPKLKSIQIGRYSFSDYHSLELSNLPSLQIIDIGESCFRSLPSFSLTGLIG